MLLSREYDPKPNLANWFAINSVAWLWVKQRLIYRESIEYHPGSRTLEEVLDRASETISHLNTNKET